MIKLGSKKIVASVDNIRFKVLRGIIRPFVIRKVCKQNNVKILHFNGGTPTGFFHMFGAKLGGVKWITFHSHSGGFDNKEFLKRIANRICRPLLKFVVSDYWACSTLAAEYSFPKRVFKNNAYYYFPNAIDLEKYKYNSNERQIIRKKLNVQERFVVGHAGRFEYPKNHEFLIDIFEKIYEKNNKAILLLFGNGSLEDEIKSIVSKKNMEDCVRFCGLSYEMEKMYQAMDVLLMPSHFEGLPVAGVEAQASGLPVIFSDVITREVAVSPYVEYVSLDETANDWADKTLKYEGISRKDYCKELAEKGFDKKDMVEKFQSYYLKIGKRLGRF